jgi:hypothetical protein
MPRGLARYILLSVAVLGLLACSDRRPEFNLTQARSDLAEAFDVDDSAISIYSDGRFAEEEAVWMVDFRLDGRRELMQARFNGRSKVWVLQDVRDRGEPDEAFEPVGLVVGDLLSNSVDSAFDTMDLLEEVAGFVESFATTNNNAYPAVDIRALAQLVVRAELIESWEHAQDGWGGRIYYFATRQGDAYILVSPGADGIWDIPTAEYARRTQDGDQSFDGFSSDLDADIILATGSFVQGFEPDE